MKNHLKMKGTVLFGIIIMFALSICETPAMAQQTPLPGQPIAHFPKMVVGDSWVFEGHSYMYGWDTFQQKVIKVEEDGGFVTEVTGEKEGIRHRYFDKEYRHIKEIKIPEGIQFRTPVPPEKRIQFPMFVGKRWEDEYLWWSPIDKKYLRFTNDATVEKYETVETKGGTFQAFRIIKRYHVPETKWSGINTYWYSPEVKREVKSIPNWRKEGLELIRYQLSVVEKRPEIEKPKVVIKGEKIKVAVIEFQSLNDEAQRDNLGKIVSEILTTSFVNSESFKIIEREQLQKVTKEFELSQTGIIDTSSAKQIGKILGADAIVTGAVIMLGRRLRLDARIIDVASGIILTAEKSEGEVDLQSIGLMADRIVGSLVTKFYTDKK
jgi:TolB-like protein